MDVTIDDSISNEDLDPIALAYSSAGGYIADLPSVIGISPERVEEYLEWMRSKLVFPVPDRRYPILIPETSPTSYISFKCALNLRLEDVDEEWVTGDWHFEESFFGFRKQTYTSLAGRPGLIDTVPALGSLGVRDMAQVIADAGIRPNEGPVWVANHYRAIADTCMHQLAGSYPKGVLTPCQINDLLWTEQDIDTLVEDYLKPLRRLTGGAGREVFDKWLPTVVYGVTYR